MASSSGGRKKRLVSSLDGEVLERLSMKLNPRMLMKDYQSLAGRLKYTYEYIRNFARERDPTLTLLQHWWSSKRGKEKTVSVLIEHLSDMERDDAVDLLRPYEYYSSHEAAEYDESFERPMGYAVAGGVNRDPGFPGRENEHHQQAIEPGACKPDLHRCLWEPEQNQRANFNGSYMLQNRKVANSVPNAIKDSFQSDISTPSEVLQEPVGKNLQFAYHDTSSRLDGDNVGSFSFNTFNKELDYSDGFCGARRDIRVPGVQRPWTLDGSSASSVDGEYYCQISSSPQRLFKHGPVMRDYHDPRRYSEQFREGIDPRYIQSDYGGLAAAEGHTLTAAADKVALVIGNQNYAHSKLKGLQYPEQDAADVATALTQLNFKVVSLVNLTLSEMRTAMLAFCCLLGKGVYGVVYYAGHGYEDNGENFLLPVDSDLKYNREDSLRTQEILETMQQCDTSLNLLIIDACRVSLPNKSGITVPRIKRSVKGNNIFAYSCCSLQESLEEPNCRNGMYCSHLLRRLRENRRVENMLMDVASDFARTYNLKQRPCLETDSMMDFRLTDPIHPEFLPEEFKERLRRWNEAKRYPGQFSVENSDLQVFFEFQAPFSNVLCVFVSVVKKTQVPLAELYLSLQTHDPLRCVEKECVEMQSNPSDKLMSRQTFEITNIQKMYKSQESLMLSVDAMYKVSGKLARYEKTVDLSWPLVSNIICLWDSWLLGDRCKSTAV